MFHSLSRYSKQLTIVSLLITTALAGCGGGSSTTLPFTPAIATESRLAVASDPTTAALLRRGDPMTRLASVVLADHPTAFYKLADTTEKLSDWGPLNIAGSFGSAVQRGSVPITLGASASALFPGGETYNPQGYATVSPNANFQTPHVTVEAWFVLNAPNNTAHDIPLVIYGTLSRSVRYGLFVHGQGNGLQCLLYEQHNAGSVSIAHTGKTHLRVGATYHVVAVSDGSNVTLYLNGNVDSTVAFPGSIDYSAPLKNGLQIGGAVQTGANEDVSFPGNIAQVAVYGAPLSASRVVAHFLAGQMVPIVTETPANADSLADSIGVNAHFDNDRLTYATAFSQVKTLLVNSGIRHVREAISYNQNYLQMMSQLGTAGIHVSYLTNSILTRSQVQGFPALTASTFEQYEAPNEQDDQGITNWAPGCIAFQKSLYSWVKSDAKVAHFAVLGPALTKSTSYPMVGDLSAYMDNGNMHDYFGIFNPGTHGWGSMDPPYGVYGSLPYNMNLVRVVSGGKPIVATETGYATQPGNPNTLDDRADVRYTPRLIFEHFNAGVARTYIYEFLDEVGGGVFGFNGLVHTDLTPKPAYTAVKSVIGELSDPGSPFVTTPLTYSLSGFVNNVAHTLLQRRDGTYVLALWLEVPNWGTSGVGGDIINPAQYVTLTTTGSFASATLNALQDDGTIKPVPIAWTGSSAYIPVNDSIEFIELHR